MDMTSWRRFDDIPDGQVFADKFGRLYTKQSAGRATDHAVLKDGLWEHQFDTSREYYQADDDELDDWSMWDSWPFYRVEGVEPWG